ncbi:MAG TPA: GNAT family N-acetyltransferase [Gammaproteobacteria bacterium]|nr:GNAT family N-acetyltransferase [Gammaproteobacteria bacterium]
MTWVIGAAARACCLIFRVPPAAEAFIRPAAASEAAQLSALALRSKAHWGYSAAFIEACREELTYDSDYLGTNTVFVAESDAGIVGFYALERISESEAELTAMFVEPKHIGRGIGCALITHAKETARGSGFRSIIIQGDPNAVAFYQAAGGARCGERESGSIPGRVLPLFRIPL